MTSAPTTEPPVVAHPRRRDDEFGSERHVYEPHRVGLPPLRSYARELWRRRAFAFELSRTELRAQHFDTLFGQLWLILNPILLGAVYFFLVDILRHGSRGSAFFAHLLGAIFAYYFVSGAIRQAVTSVTSGGKLILNTAFPRVLLPVSSVITGFKRFLPTIPIYLIVHVASGIPLRLAMLWTIPIALLLLVLAAGLSMLVAALQVYFRDLKDFLPYLLRLWLYASPVLYYAEEVPHRYRPLLLANPLGPMLRCWSDVLDKGQTPPLHSMLLSAAYAGVLFAIGALFFISREREFAVRL